MNDYERYVLQGGTADAAPAPAPAIVGAGGSGSVGGSGGTGATGSSASVLQLTNTDTTTNVNQTAFTDVPLGTALTIGSDFTQSGSGIVTGFTGHVELSASIYMESTSQRPAVVFAFFKNGVDLGVRYNTSYIRSGSGHNEASTACTPFVAACSPSDVFTVRGQRDANSGTVTMRGSGSSFFTAKRIN
jgi:hypothetical protein